jgi:hypothetical protein
MTKTLTITMSDEQYEALQAAATRAQRSPEEQATVTLAERLHGLPDGELPGTSKEDPLIAIMRARGHLVDPTTLPPYPGVDEIPPEGTPERKQFEEELGNELSDALEQSGLSILDLIERR